MHILDQNVRKGHVKLRVENLDDLWYLSQIVDPGDRVGGRTERKIRIGSSEDRKTQVVKKIVNITILVEKAEFHKHSDTLRISGTIADGPEDVARGTHHTFNVCENTTITITKEEWLQYQLQKLKEAASDKGPKILICIFDRENALFALNKKYGYEFLTELRGAVAKKDYDVKASDFYSEIAKALGDYDRRLGPDRIVIASPAFWKDYLFDSLTDELKKKSISATCSSVGRAAIGEILRRPELQTLLKEERISQETNLVEDLLLAVSNDIAAYGRADVSEAGAAGAVKILLVTDAQIQDPAGRAELDQLMKGVERSKGQVHIIGTEHEAGKKLAGLGGVGAILRYRIK
ncbi:MAG: mRNA surveillance protein pelota [archaeon]